MKKSMIKRTAMIISAFTILGAMPVYAAEGVSNDTVTLQKDIETKANTYTFGKKTISKNQTAYFKVNNTNMIIWGGETVKFTCNFSSSAKVQIYFYDSITGTSKSLYSGTTSSKTVSYKPSSKVSGYFYLKNLSGKSLTINSAKIVY